MPTRIGLDIGTNAVRAAKVSTNRDGEATLENIGQVILPPGAVRDGEVVDPQTVAECLTTLWSERGLRSRKVAVGVANQQVVTRLVDLPAVSDEELAEAVPLQASEHVPIPLDSATLDWSVLERFADGEGNEFVRVALVAAHRDMVERLLEALRLAKLDPITLDLDAFALLRALAADHLPETEGAEVLVDVGTSITDIIAHEHGAPRFVRELTMGSGRITDGLITQLAMRVDEAERTKALTGCSGGPPPEGVSPEAVRIVADRARDLVEEVRGSLDYYRAQDHSVPVRRALLTGGGAQLTGLSEMLSEALEVPVEPARPLSNLKVGRTGLTDEELEEAEPFLSVAIGLALAPTS